MESGILNLTPQRLRLIVREASGHDISSTDAEAYLRLFGDNLEQVVLQAVRKIIIAHFGKR